MMRILLRRLLPALLVVMAVCAPGHALRAQAYPAGIAPSALRALPAPLTGIKAIAAGYSHTCALTTRGGVKCWGANQSGQLGDGTRTSQRMPVDVQGLDSGVQAIAAGGFHTCALLESGRVNCWGSDEEGQLGNGPDIRTTLTPDDVFQLGDGVVQIATGDLHTCALKDTGVVYCWGDDGFGQIGDGPPSEAVHIPVIVSNLTGIKQIAAGGYHMCEVTTAGAALCAGYDIHGQIGEGNPNDNHSVPTSVAFLDSGIAAVSGGYFHSCALTEQGGLLCWGLDRNGQLGDGPNNDSKATPEAVIGLSTGVLAAGGGSSHTCALLFNGSVRCWGEDRYGQVGDGSSRTDKVAPIGVLTLDRNVQAIAVGGYHTCALTTGGAVQCWGLNDNGQLGDNTAESRPAPVAVLVPQYRILLPFVGR